MKQGGKPALLLTRDRYRALISTKMIHRILIIIFLVFLLQISHGQTSTDKVLKIIESTHVFSSNSEMDTFRLTLKGKSISVGKVLFEIISSEGKRIHHEIIESNLLIGYGLLGIENPTEMDKSNYIIKRMNEFFSIDNFSTPAIPEDEQFDEDYHKKDSFYRIKGNLNSISFMYKIGEGDIRRIAFLDNKVIIFWNCC